MTPEILNQYESEIGTFAPMTEGQRFREVIAYVRELEKDKARLDWLNDHGIVETDKHGEIWQRGYAELFDVDNVRQAIDNAKE